MGDSPGIETAKAVSDSGDLQFMREVSESLRRHKSERWQVAAVLDG